MNEIILGIIAILCQGFFAGSETAFSRANWIRLTTWQRRHSAVSILHLHADTTLKLLTRKEHILIISLILNNLFIVIASVIFSRFFIIRFGSAYTVIAVLIVVILSLIVGDFLPKVIAQAFPEYWAIISGSLIRLFLIIFTPILPKTEPKHYNQLSRRDFLYLLKEKTFKESLVINQMAKALFEFSKMTVSDIMVPKERIIAFAENADFRDVKKIVERYRFSRYPVCQENTNRIIAIVHIKDILKLSRTKITNISNIFRTPQFVSPDEKAMIALRKMSRKGEHISIVQNEKKATVGIITLEDLIEELVGEIRSEA